MFYLRAEVQLGWRGPGMCAYRHILIPGRVTVHFMHCACQARSQSARGHDAWLCRDCVDEGRGDEAWLYPAGHRPEGMAWQRYD